MLGVPAAGKAAVQWSSSAHYPAEKRELEGSFLHTVYFWLADPTPGNRERFLNEINPFIMGVEEIRTWHIGAPADTDRDVIDNSYSYCLSVSFDSKKEHDLYQDHPLHKQFIENASSLWERVAVYDSVKI